MWKIKLAFKAALQRLKHPVTRLHSGDWSPEDHSHICIAARLLDTDDFETVCPFKGQGDIEHEYRCDYCPYMRILEFDISDLTGRKIITLQ